MSLIAVVLLLAAQAVGPPPSVVLAGQSNALYSAEAVSQQLAPEPVLDAAHPGQPISRWQESSPYWSELAQSLHGRTDAFVWWQGESDRANPGYEQDLRRFLGRVRTEAHNPRLLVVVVQVLDLPENADVRAAQQRVVAGDLFALIVSSDCDQRLGTSDHLTATGYEIVAGRIRVALAGRRP